MADTFGLIGLGSMGRVIARTLLLRGVPLTVWGRNPSRVQEAVDRTAAIAADPHDLARRCSVIALCLPNANAVQQVVFAAGGLAEQLRPGSILVDLTSARPEDARALADCLAESSIYYVDAPIIGSPLAAAARGLRVPVGGDAAAVERARALLREIADPVVHVGPAGSGQAMRLVHQAMLGINAVAMGEGVVLARAIGADPALLHAFLSGSQADNGILASCDEFGTPDPNGHPAQMLAQDLGLANRLGARLGLRLPALATSADLCQRIAFQQPDPGVIGISTQFQVEHQRLAAATTALEPSPGAVRLLPLPETRPLRRQGTAAVAATQSVPACVGTAPTTRPVMPDGRSGTATIPRRRSALPDGQTTRVVHRDSSAPAASQPAPRPAAALPGYQTPAWERSDNTGAQPAALHVSSMEPAAALTLPGLVRINWDAAGRRREWVRGVRAVIAACFAGIVGALLAWMGGQHDLATATVLGMVCGLAIVLIRCGLLTGMLVGGGGVLVGMLASQGIGVMAPFQLLGGILAAGLLGLIEQGE